VVRCRNLGMPDRGGRARGLRHFRYHPSWRQRSCREAPGRCQGLARQEGEARLQSRQGGVLRSGHRAAHRLKMRDFDYIIAGGGSAGCVLASRLSEDKEVRVLLLEAGGSDRHPLFHIPAGFARMTKGIASWGWSTVPQKHMQDRIFWYTQAKVIGG